MAESSRTPADERTAYKALPVKSLVADDTWYLLEIKWWKAWKDYVGLETGAPRSYATQPGRIDNSPLIDPQRSDPVPQPGDPAPPADAQYICKKTLSESYEYVLLDLDQWTLLQGWYGGGPPLPRKVIYSEWRKAHVVEVRPLVLRLVVSTDKTKETVITISKNATIGDMKKDIAKQFDYEVDNFRLWDYHGSTKIKLLDELDQKMDDAQIIDDQIVLVELKGEDGSWPKDSYHATSSLYNVPSGGPRSVTSGYSTSSSYTSTYRTNQGSGHAAPPGQCGLSNLGNTCFMASALQCLSHVAPLVEYFKSGRYKEDINEANPLGCKGALAEEYAQLVVQMWSGQHSYVAPREFKHKLERFAPQFSGYQQHDSQELLAYLLDGLHEDLNRVRQKPYVENPEADGTTVDLQSVAAKAWSNHLLRNNSIIVDWFQGQLKSTLVCPNCNRRSVTFDPFMYLSVPLPVTTTRVVTVSIVPHDPSQEIYKLKVTVGKHARISDLKTELARVTTMVESRMFFADVYSHRFYRTFTDYDRVESIREGDIFACYELAPPAPEGADYTIVHMPLYLLKQEEVKYHGSQQTYTRKALFGMPVMLSVPNKATYDQLMHVVTKQLRGRMLKADPPLPSLAPSAAPVLSDSSSSSSSSSSRNSGAGSPPKEGDGETKKDGDAEADTKKDAEAVPEAKKDADAVPEAKKDSEADADPKQDGASETKKDAEAETKKDAEAETKKDAEAETTKEAETEGEAKKDGETSADEETEREPVFEIVTCDSYGQADGSLPRALLVLRGGVMPLALRWTSETDIAEFYDDKWATNLLPEPATASEDTVSTENALSLDDCLKLFTVEEKLSKDDSWYCRVCQDHVQATKKFDLWTMPRVLMIHLKRFSFESRYSRDKIDTPVNYPTQGLDLSTYIPAEALATQEAPLYDLIAVSNHYGGVGGGHYTAHAKNYKDNKMYKFDDSSVSLSSDASAVNPAGYVLFYLRRDISPEVISALSVPSSPMPPGAADDADEPEPEGTSAAAAAAPEDTSDVSAVDGENVAPAGDAATAVASPITDAATTTASADETVAPADETVAPAGETVGTVAPAAPEKTAVSEEGRMETE